MEPLNNGHGGDEHFVPSSEVEMYGQLMAGGKQFVHCREVVLLWECPLSEVLLYWVNSRLGGGASDLVSCISLVSTVTYQR